MNKILLWALAVFLLLTTTANAQTIHGDQLRDNTVAEVKLDVANSPTTNYVFSWDGVRFEWQPVIMGSGTDNHLVRWDGTDAIQDSGWILADTDAMTVADGTLDLSVPSGSSLTTGNVFKVLRNLASGSTDSPLVEIIQDNASDDQVALNVQQDGALSAINAGGASTTNGVGTIVGNSTGATGRVYGVRGITSSSDNAAYGGFFDKIRAGIYADLSEDAAPDAAPTDKVRLYALTGGRLNTVDDTITIGPLGSELADVNSVSIATTIAPVVGMPHVTTVDAVGGARIMTLPAADEWGGQFITIVKTDSTVNIVTVDGDGSDTIDGELTYDLVITNESITLVSDNVSNWFITAANLHHRIDITSYIDIKTKNRPSIHGAIVEEATGQQLTSVFALPFQHGQGRMGIVVNAGTDTAGTITITGTSVSRSDSDSETGSDTEVITIAGLTTDNSANDGLGFNVWDFQDIYLSTKWFQGAITLSTTDLDLSDVDVYLINYDQFGDHPDVILQGLEAEGFKTNTAGEMSVHLYSVFFQAGSRWDVQSISSLEHAASKTVTNMRVKMKESGIAMKFDGSTDGILLEMNMNRLNQTDWEDVTTHIYLISLGDL